MHALPKNTNTAFYMSFFWACHLVNNIDSGFVWLGNRVAKCTDRPMVLSFVLSQGVYLKSLAYFCQFSAIANSQLFGKLEPQLTFAYSNVHFPCFFRVFPLCPLHKNTL